MVCSATTTWHPLKAFHSLYNNHMTQTERIPFFIWRPHDTHWRVSTLYMTTTWHWLMGFQFLYDNLMSPTEGIVLLIEQPLKGFTLYSTTTRHQLRGFHDNHMTPTVMGEMPSSMLSSHSVETLGLRKSLTICSTLAVFASPCPRFSDGAQSGSFCSIS